MTDSPRETRVLAAVVALVDSLLDDFDVVELLTDLTERCAELLDVDAAGLLLADPRRQLQLMAATSESSRDVELFELHAEQGPCLDCYATSAAVSVPDLGAEAARWPWFVSGATGAGFASVHAVPLHAAGITLGALGLFGIEPVDLGDADLLVAHTLAHVACVAILQGHPSTAVSALPRLRTALNSRVVVEQAKGCVREALDVSVEDAFVLLRFHARTHRVHLTDVSRRLISDPDARGSILEVLRDAHHGASRP